MNTHTTLREAAAVSGEGANSPRRHVPYGKLPRQKLDIYLPRDGKVKATIVYFYGGGWISGARWHYRLFGRMMAARGYAVVIPDYHLYPHVRFPAFNEDAALAFKWVHDQVTRWGGEPSRLFVMGHSAGAHIAAMLALDPGYLAVHGLTRSAIKGVIGLAGPYTLDPFKWTGTKDVFAPAAAAPGSARPIKLVCADAPAMLLLHGTHDRVAGAHASEHLAAALVKAGSVARAIVYPGIGHFTIFLCYLPGLRWRAPALKDTEEFIAGMG